MKPTSEQAHAVDAFHAGGTLVIEAGAGSGKTSTLRMLANAKRVNVADLARYMALCGTQHAGPLGAAWRAAPLSSAALAVCGRWRV